MNNNAQKILYWLGSIVQDWTYDDKLLCQSANWAGLLIIADQTFSNTLRYMRYGKKYMQCRCRAVTCDELQRFAIAMIIGGSYDHHKCLLVCQAAKSRSNFTSKRWETAKIKICWYLIRLSPQPIMVKFALYMPLFTIDSHKTWLKGTFCERGICSARPNVCTRVMLIFLISWNVSKVEKNVAMPSCQSHNVIEETVLNRRYSLMSFNDHTRIYWMSQSKNDVSHKIWSSRF